MSKWCSTEAISVAVAPPGPPRRPIESLHAQVLGHLRLHRHLRQDPPPSRSTSRPGFVPAIRGKPSSAILSSSVVASVLPVGATHRDENQAVVGLT